MEKKNEGSMSCLVLAAVLFGVVALSTVLGLILEGESFLSSFLDEDSEGTNIRLLRWTFIFLLIAGGLYAYDNSKKKK